MSKRLPPCPELPKRARLEAKSNLFAELDSIANVQIARGLSSNGVALFRKSRLKDELSFVRRSVYVAGIRAWERADHWSRKKQAIRAALAKRLALLDRMRSDAHELSAIAKRGRSKLDVTPLCDPTLSLQQEQEKIVLDQLERANELIDYAIEHHLNSVTDSWKERDIGRCSASIWMGRRGNLDGESVSRRRDDCRADCRAQEFC